MLGWLDDINQVTSANTNFRTVVYTGEHTQRVGRTSGLVDRDQFLRLEQGHARVDFGRTEAAVDEHHEVADDWAFIVPADVWHNVVNIGEDEVKLYSLYSPPEHPDGTVHRTKADADAAEHDED